MPILNGRVGIQAQGLDGKPIIIPPPTALWKRGPCVQVTVELAEQVAQELIKRNEPLPGPVTGWALIDTGATSSCVDEEVAKSMKLPIVGTATLTSASHSSYRANQYPIRIKIQGLPIAFNAPTAIGAPIKGQHLVAIIGRDMLQVCCFIYNGLTGHITLCL